jgi:hypothetical protein
VNALLAAASNEDGKGGRSAQETAMLNAMLGMASGGNAADLFGMADQQPGTSQTHPDANTTEEQDAAIRQLLASLHGNGRNGEQEVAEMDVAAALAQMSG